MAEPVDVLEMTRALVAVPSVNPDLEAGGDGEAGVASLAAGWLESWGFDVEVMEAAPGRASVVAQWGEGPRSVILNGHLDTVGVEGMTVDPYAGAVRDGLLYGRGSCDMKAGVAALLAAARDTARAGVRGRLIVALTADEEYASVGLQQVLGAGLRADAAVVCEPTSLAIMPANKGFVWVEVDFEGRAAHGSLPAEGVDAIRHAGRLLERLDRLDAELADRPAHPLLGRGSIHAGTVRGGSTPSVYPAHCRLLLERRTLPGETPESALSEVDALLDGLRAELPRLRASARITLDRPGTEVDERDEPVTSLLGALEDTGIQPRLQGMTAWVDAALFNVAGIPAVCFGPGAIAQAHTADEHVAVAELEPAHAALTAFVRRFLAAS